MFLSTRDYHYLYKFIVGASKISCEKLVKKKLDLLIFERKKLPSLDFIIYFFYIVLSGKIFKKERSKITYKNIEIGRFVISNTYFNFETYASKIVFYKQLLKNFIAAGSIFNTCEKYYKNYKIDGVYVDHAVFLNGIIYSYFSKKKIPVYANNYPHGIFFVNNKKNKKKYLEKYEKALRINLKKKINNNQKKIARKKVSELTKNKNFIPWLQQLKFKKIKELKYKKFDYVIYAHSFTDGQMAYGYDGFETTLEWLEYTLNIFVNTNKNILVKPHPNFYNNSLAIYAKCDKKIYNIVKEKYKKFKNIYFLQTPIHNYQLQKKLDRRKCIAITKYGSVVLESSFMNFKTICSDANFFHSKFKISNRWKNIQEYRKLLETDFKKLAYPKQHGLHQLVHALFFVYNSTYNINSYYETIICKNLDLTPKIFYDYTYVKARNKITKSKINKLNNLINKNLEKINYEILKKVWEVKN